MNKIRWDVALLWFVILILISAFWITAIRALAQTGSNTIGISIKSADKVEVIAFPVLSPAIYFTVEGVRPEKGLLLCTQVSDTATTASGTTYPIVRLNCGKTVLTISGISFQ